MSRFRRYEIIDHSPSFLLKETSIFAPRRTLLLNPCFPIVEDDLDSALDLLTFAPTTPSLLFDDLEAVTDLIQIDETPFHNFTTRRVTRRVGLGDFYLQALSDRVSALESGFDRLLREERCGKKKIGERKYTWTAEIKSPEKDRKYKWEAERKGLEKSYKWTAEIKRKGGADESPIEQTYTIKVSSGAGKSKEEEKKEKKKCGKDKEKEKAPRIVEIEEPTDNGGIVLRQVCVG